MGTPPNAPKKSSLLHQKINTLQLPGGADRLITGAVCVPLHVDVDSAFLTDVEIKRAAHRFFTSHRSDFVDVEHKKAKTGVVVVESYIAPIDNPDNFVPGSWIATMRVDSDKIWEDVENGTLNGFSFDGQAYKEQVPAIVRAISELEITTEPYPADGHTHTAVLNFNEQGFIYPSSTNSINNHYHQILKANGTETSYNAHDDSDAKKHSHRFSVAERAPGTRIISTIDREIMCDSLSGVTVNWISLVKHPAHREPFHVTKGDTKMDRVIQAILIDKSLQLDDVWKDIPELSGFDKTNLLVKRSIALTKRDKHVLLDPDVFDADTLHEVVSTRRGVSFLVGITKSDMPNAIVVGDQATEHTILQLAESLFKERKKGAVAVTKNDVTEADPPTSQSPATESNTDQSNFDQLSKMITDVVSPLFSQLKQEIAEAYSPLLAQIKESTNKDDQDTPDDEAAAVPTTGELVQTLLSSHEKLLSAVQKSDTAILDVTKRLVKLEGAPQTPPGAVQNEPEVMAAPSAGKSTLSWRALMSTSVANTMRS